MKYPPIYDVVQMLRTPSDGDKTFGSKRYHFPRQKLTLDVNHGAMSFFTAMSDGVDFLTEWDFVDFQDTNRKLEDDEYEEVLHKAVEWCKQNCNELDWQIAGNDFLFRNQSDAAAFIWNFFD